MIKTETEELKALRKLYRRLLDHVEMDNKKFVDRPALLSMMDTTSNSRFRLLNSASLPTIKIPRNIRKELLTKGLIRETDTLGDYTLTAKGIWEVERATGRIEVSALIDYIDEKFFNVYQTSSQNLRDKEKILLFAMISARAFSKESSLDLSRGGSIDEAWQKIIDSTFELLKSLKLVSYSKEQLYGTIGNEPPVSRLFRRTQELPKKTKGIFKFSGKKQFWLDLALSDDIQDEKLRFLLGRIFEERELKLPEIDEICKFADNIAHNKAVYVFDVHHHKFSNPKYDSVLRDALLTIE